jgi:glycosyltransferase involved in cell wall biosynthesis
MDKIKILYLIPQLTVGGTERNLYELATRLDKSRFEPTVWCMGESEPFGRMLEAAGIRVMKKHNRVYRPDDLFGLASFLRKEGFDVFHSYHYGAHFMDAVAAKSAKVPFYVSSRMNVRHWRGGERLHFSERIRNALSAVVVANSEAVKKKCAEVENIPKQKMRVIYNGVNLKEADENSAEKTCRDHLVVGSLANLKPVKGQKYLIRAFARVLEKKPKTRLVLVGDGPDKDGLKDLAADLGIGDDVVIKVSQENRFSVIDSFDVFVSSSLAEGFSNSILEAMAKGKPVIATSVGGNSEAVIDGVNGYIVPPADPDALAAAIITLLSDDETRRRFGGSGRRRVEEYFTLEKMVGKHEKLYEDLALNGRRPRRL